MSAACQELESHVEYFPLELFDHFWDLELKESIFIGRFSVWYEDND